MDPWGHLSPWLFKDIIEGDNSKRWMQEHGTLLHRLTHSIVDIRPTIAITKAHMKLSELEDSVRSGRL